MRKILTLLAIALVALAASTAAPAANDPNPAFDALASEVAGHPVAVWCEDNAYDWDQVAYGDPEFPGPGEYLDGFTAPTLSNVIYLAPHICDSLWTAIVNGVWGYQDAGMSPFAHALLTVIHESEHQRGIADEGQAECAALPLVSQAAVKYFHVPAGWTEDRIAYKWKKVGKKRVRNP